MIYLIVIVDEKGDVVTPIAGTIDKKLAEKQVEIISNLVSEAVVIQEVVDLDEYLEEECEHNWYYHTWQMGWICSKCGERYTPDYNSAWTLFAEIPLTSGTFQYFDGTVGTATGDTIPSKRDKSDNSSDGEKDKL